MKFYLPVILSTNEFYSGKHWAKRKNIKDQYRNVPFTAEPITNYPVNCHYTFYIPNNYDTSNLSIMMKLIEDCLVKKGILENDSRKYVRRITMEAVKSNEGYCEIEITQANQS